MANWKPYIVFQNLVFFCVITQGIVNIDQETKERIDSFVESLITDCDKHAIAGMNLAVVYNGDVLYTTGYGVRNLGELCEPGRGKGGFARKSLKGIDTQDSKLISRCWKVDCKPTRMSFQKKKLLCK